MVAFVALELVYSILRLENSDWLPMNVSEMIYFQYFVFSWTWNLNSVNQSLTTRS